MKFNTLFVLQVSTAGMEVMSMLIQRMQEEFRPYLSSVIPPAIDRLGVLYLHF